MDKNALDVLLAGRSYLLLQGPMGWFFQKLADWLRSTNRIVSKVNFNAGDLFFCRDKNALNFNQPIKMFHKWLSEIHRNSPFDSIVCFGDCRPMHLIAKDWAKQNNVRFLAFEEGYLRPHFITLEEGGVNAFSSMPRDPKFYRYCSLSPVDKIEHIEGCFSRRAWHATCYYLAGWFMRGQFPHYRHHKIFSPWHETRCWLRAGLRKQFYRFKQKNILPMLELSLSKKYYLAILQVYNDSQIKNHSHYDDVRDYIREVITSFAEHAPDDKYLVFKHHPMDRGHRYYGKLIAEITTMLGISERVLYVHDLHLPTMLTHAKAVITINSTAGLSALHHAKPLKVMGEALYDIEGLTYQNCLDKFWGTNFRPDMKLFYHFKRVLQHKTQLNGVFYSAHPWMNAIKNNHRELILAPKTSKASSRNY